VCWHGATFNHLLWIYLRYFHQTSDFLTSLSFSFEHHFKRLQHNKQIDDEDWTWHPFLLAIAKAKAKAKAPQWLVQQDEQEQENKLIIVAEKNLELSASWSR
jgi:hypothetical protein